MKRTNRTFQVSVLSCEQGSIDKGAVGGVRGNGVSGGKFKF